MKELTIEQKAQRYDEILARAKGADMPYYKKDIMSKVKELVDYLLPELKENQESEDERIRKNCIHFLELQKQHHAATFEIEECISWLEKIIIPSHNDIDSSFIEDIKNVIAEAPLLMQSDKEKMVAWLEKQGDDKVEQKFKIGDWVVFNNKHQSIYQVEKIEDGYYILRHTHSGTFRVCVLHDESLRPWTIQDAKDGDVLAIEWNQNNDVWEKILIFKALNDIGVEGYGNTFKNKDLSFTDENVPYYSKTWTKTLHPATKEQRDLLFQKMKEDGYEWDVERKKLKKIDVRENLTLDGDLMEADCSLVEKKLAWSEEDEKQARQIERIVHDDGCTQKLQKQIADWFKSLKERVQSQPKQEWSEEDEKMLSNIVDCIKNLPIFYESININGEDKTTEQFICNTINWFKSLKSRVQPQPKQGWSKEDEEMWLDAVKYLELFDAQGIHGDKAVPCLNWLKSLKDKAQPQNLTVTDEELAQAKKNAYNDVLDKIEYDSENPTFDDGWNAAIWYLKKRNAIPQSQWKPTEKQLKSLELACDRNDIVGYRLAQILKELKKLKGE